MNSSTIQAEGKTTRRPVVTPLCFFRSHRSDGSNIFKEDSKLKKENRLLTIDGETLMSQPLTPLNFVVDTLLFLVSFRIQKEWVFKK